MLNLQIDPVIAECLLRLSGAFNRRTAPEVVQVWNDELAGLDADTLRETTTNLVRGHQRFPALSEFLDAADRVKSRKRNATPALELPPLTPQEIAENLERLEQLKATVFGATSRP